MQQGGGAGERSLQFLPGVQECPCSSPGTVWQRLGAVGLRASLRTSMIEGAVAELVGACASGGVLTAWALYLELPPLMIGVLGALPFASQLLHLPASWLTRRLGSRRAALWAIAVSRQCVLPLAALPWLPMPLSARQALFLFCTFLTAALGVAGNNAWTSWMGDLVPGTVRGRYFGRRTAICALSATCFSLGAGLLLDHGRPGVALCVLTLIASAAGAVTTLLLRQQQQPLRASAPEIVPVTQAMAPLRDLRARRLLFFQLVWSAAGGVAAAFYPLHMIGNLRMGFARMAAYGAGLAAFKMLASPLWGAVLDRKGARRVLVVCSFALSFSPLLWMIAAEGRLWPLAADAALCGAANAGLSLAMFALPISLSASRDRSFYVGALAAAGGFAAGAGSAAGGALAKVLPAAWSLFGSRFVAAHALFLAGAGGRLLGALAALRIVEWPAAQIVELPLRRPERAKLSA